MGVNFTRRYWENGQLEFILHKYSGDIKIVVVLRSIQFTVSLISNAIDALLSWMASKAKKKCCVSGNRALKNWVGRSTNIFILVKYFYTVRIRKIIPHYSFLHKGTRCNKVGLRVLSKYKLPISLYLKLL